MIDAGLIPTPCKTVITAIDNPVTYIKGVYVNESKQYMATFVQFRTGVTELPID